MNPEQLRAVTDNVWFTLISRGSMALLGLSAPFLIWVGSLWMERQFAPIQSTLTSLDNSVDEIKNEAVEAEKRLKELETHKQLKELVDQKQDFFIESNKQTVTEVKDSINKLTDAVIKATNRRSSLEDFPPWSGSVQP